MQRRNEEFQWPVDGANYDHVEMGGAHSTQIGHTRRTKNDKVDQKNVAVKD